MRFTERSPNVLVVVLYTVFGDEFPCQWSVVLVICTVGHQVLLELTVQTVKQICVDGLALQLFFNAGALFAYASRVASFVTLSASTIGASI